jgi:hypothetical protein
VGQKDDVTIWLFNIAMGNGPFIDGLPNLKTVIFHGELLNNQMLVKYWGPNQKDSHLWSILIIFGTSYKNAGMGKISWCTGVK